LLFCSLYHKKSKYYNSNREQKFCEKIRYQALKQVSLLEILDSAMSTEIYATVTHAELTTRYKKKVCIKVFCVVKVT